MTKEQWPTVKLGTLLSPVGVAERITQPEDETFVTLKLHGGGAVPRNIGAGKTPKPFIGFRIRTNQFIYSRIDARNGAFAIVPKALDGAVVSKDFPVFSIGELVESRYLAYFCTTPSFEKLVQVKSSGATNRQRIKEDLFLSLEIPLPPLEEQRRIARKLSLNQSTILRIQKSIEMLENFRVQSAVRMFESARQTLLLGDFCDTFGGTSLPTESPFKGEDSGILLMRVSDMNSVGNELFINSTVSWSDDDSFMKRNFVAPAGSTILPKRGASISTNKKRLAVRPTYLDPNLMGVLPDSTVLKGVCMYYWFKTFDLNSITSGSSVPQLNKKDLTPLQIPIPDPNTQDMFVKLFNQTLAIERHLQQQIALARELQSSLSTRAFTGEL